MSDTVRIFAGTSPNGEDYEAEAVFAFSLAKHSSLPVDITWMRQSKKGPYSGWRCARNRTPFSGFRWSGPAMCDFKGRSLYADVDVIWCADIAQLWNQDIAGVLVCRKSKKIHGKLKTCVTLFDNERANGHVPTLDDLKKMEDPQGTLSKYFQMRDELTGNYADGDWNSLDLGGYELDDPRVKAIHYTRMEHQLHLKHAIPRLKAQGKSHWYTGPVFAHPRPELQARFDHLLEEAKSAGFTYESFGYGFEVEISRRNFTYSHHRGVPAA